MTSGFLSIHPFVGFFYFLGAILFFTLIKHPFYLISFLGVTIFWLILLGQGQSVLKSSRTYGVMILFILILNPLFNNKGEHILFYVFNRSITLESLLYGFNFALSLLNILLIFRIYNLVITPQKFLYLFANLIPKTSFILSITMRFIPLFTRRAKEILEVSPRDSKKLTSSMHALNTLVSWTLEESLENATSMRARGYGTHKRTSATIYSFALRDYSVLLSFIILFVIFFLGYFLGLGYFEFFPSLSTLSLSFYGLLHYFCCLLFIGLPMLIEMREYTRWHLMK